MPTSQQSQSDIREHLAEQLDWRFAERNDAAVAQALYAGQAVDAVHTLDEAGLLDGFFAFLNESEVMAVWRDFRIDSVQRIFIPTIYFVLLYGTRVLFGIESSNALPALLFSNVAVMTLLGFNALAVAEPTSSLSSPASPCPVSPLTSAPVTTSCAVMVACHNHPDWQSKLQIQWPSAIPCTVTPGRIRWKNEQHLRNSQKKHSHKQQLHALVGVAHNDCD